MSKYSEHLKLKLFYYNPDDPSPIIERENGKGITINFASKEGKRIFLFIMIPAIIGIMIAGFIVVLSMYY